MSYKDFYSVKVLDHTTCDYLIHPITGKLVENISLEMKYPRVVHQEFMTHRTHCLPADVVIEFDLPTANKNGTRRKYTTTLGQFVRKWDQGSKPRKPSRRKEVDLSTIIPTKEYTASEIASIIGHKNPNKPTNINNLCKIGKIAGARKEKRSWMMLGSSVIDWRNSLQSHNIVNRLSSMQIRQYNETTGKIQNSTVEAVIDSGLKEVWVLEAGDYKLPASNNHLILTDSGWKRLEDIQIGEHIVVRRNGKLPDEIVDPNRYKKINGQWTVKWNKSKREELKAIDPLCRSCKTNQGVEIHHIVPIHQDSSKAFDDSNVTLLCTECHNQEHVVQGWQGNTYLYGDLVAVTGKTFRGVEQCYDLTIAGEFPNFIANGVVVHNSRNSGSSRARPANAVIKSVREEPYVPFHWGKNQAGMQAHEEISKAVQIDAEIAWEDATQDAIESCQRLNELGLHKQLVNRVIEPYTYITVVTTATEWDNFVNQRDHSAADPVIRKLGQMVRKAIEESTPRILKDETDWHLPLFGFEGDEEYIGQEYTYLNVTLPMPVWLSVGRCARASYLTHDGRRDPQKDLQLATETLASNAHWSPMEHAARPMSRNEWNARLGIFHKWNKGIAMIDPSIKDNGETFLNCGNFTGYVQARKYFADERVAKYEG